MDTRNGRNGLDTAFKVRVEHTEASVRETSRPRVRRASLMSMRLLRVGNDDGCCGLSAG